jgi:hypothetical protein
VSLCQSPILKEAVFVDSIPFKYGVKSAPGKTSFDDSTVDVNRDPIFSVLCMEVRRAVIVIKHVYHDPEKPANFWH